MLKVVGQVGRWLQSEELTIADLDESAVDVFITARRDAGYRQIQNRDVFTELLGHLRALGATPNAMIPTPTAMQLLVAQYRRWLFDERDLASTTVLRYEKVTSRRVV